MRLEFRAGLYNVVGRTFIAAFPVLAPMIAYWIWGQATMLDIAQALNLASYLAVLALSGPTLPQRDFRDCRTAAAETAYRNAYAILCTMQLAALVVALAMLFQAAPFLYPAVSHPEHFHCLIIGIAGLHIHVILSSPWHGFLLARAHHVAPNAFGIVVRAIALLILVLAGIAHLSLTVVGATWLVMFALSPYALWRLAKPHFRVSSSPPPVFAALRHVTKRSAIYGFWSLLMAAVQIVPLTFVAHRWPSAFGGINYAVLAGTAAMTLVMGMLVPTMNTIQDHIGNAHFLDSLFELTRATIVHACGFAALLFLLTWPFHGWLVGPENVDMFRWSTPMVLTAIGFRLQTWPTTQTGIALGMRFFYLLVPTIEVVITLGVVYLIANQIGPLGVPAGLMIGALARSLLTSMIETPRIRAAWRVARNPQR